MCLFGQQGRNIGSTGTVWFLWLASVKDAVHRWVAQKWDSGCLTIFPSSETAYFMLQSFSMCYVQIFPF